MLLIDRRLLEEAMSHYVDGYTFKPVSNGLELFNSSFKVNKDAYISKMKGKFGNDCIIAIKGQKDELISDNIKRDLPYVQKYLKNQEVNFDITEQVQLQESLETMNHSKQYFEEWFDSDKIMTFDTWFASKYQDKKNILFFVLYGNPVQVLISKERKLDVDSVEYNEFKQSCEERYSDRSYAFGFLNEGGSLDIEPHLQEEHKDIDNKSLIEMIRQSFIRKYQIYLESHTW